MNRRVPSCLPKLPIALLLPALALAACRAAPAAPEHAVHDLVAELPVAEATWETRRADLGTPAGRAALGDGWGRNERDEDGVSFVWSLGREATLELVVLVPRDLELEISARAFPAPDAPAQRLAFFAGTGRGAVALGELELEPRWRTYRLHLPRRVLVSGLNVLTVRHAWSRSPAAVRGSRDRRPLAAAWRWLRLVDSGAAMAAGDGTHEVEAGPPGPAAAPRALPERGLLHLPAGSRIDFFLPLPAGSILAAERLVARDGAALRVSLLPEAPPGAPPSQGGERVLAGDAGRAQGWRLPLGPEATLARLRLEVPAGPGSVVLEHPRIVAPEGSPMPPEAARLDGVTAAAGDRAPQNAAPAPSRPHVVLYVVDTLRADALGSYGNPRPVSPHLDAFAADAVLFEHARAQAPWTQPSVASLFTGLWPGSHGVVRGDTRLPADLPSLPRLLADAGYATGAAVANGYITEPFGFAAGFERFTLLPDPLTRAEAVQDAALAHLAALTADGSGRPVFLYLHTIDPHAPYDPPPAMRRRFAPGVPPEAGSMERTKALADGREVPRRPAEVASRLAALYDGDVAWQDHQLGHFFDALRRAGLYDQTLIVLVSDHGEEFGEHGRWTHGLGLHREVLDVPLVVRWPGGRQAGTRVTAPAQHVDVLPTVLAAAGLPRPPGLEGIDLARLVADPAAAAERPVYSHLDRFSLEGASLEWGRWKLILPRSRAFGDGPLLYDRRTDPAERHDLAAERPVLAGWLATAVRRKLAATPATGPAETAVIDEETRRRLRALGYLH
ncbi:MAG TPA: sulfatase [Thermoanaerobaculia bacterium]|nr:sulfatase [Thermoanaerobaculia bacterium]